jgi:hypothetical protein
MVRIVPGDQHLAPEEPAGGDVGVRGVEVVVTHVVPPPARGRALGDHDGMIIAREGAGAPLPRDLGSRA